MLINNKEIVKINIIKQTFNANKEAIRTTLFNQFSTNVISSFKDEYSFLSNFFLLQHPLVITVDEKQYKFFTLENAYQAMKCKDEKDIKLFESLTPEQAKKEGRYIELRDDWELVKDTFMYNLLLNKFSAFSAEAKHNVLRFLLLDTASSYLVEGNYWHDNYWGVCNCKNCNGTGQNKLGNFLMIIRHVIKQQEKKIYSKKK